MSGLFDVDLVAGGVEIFSEEVGRTDTKKYLNLSDYSDALLLGYLTKHSATEKEITSRK